MTPEPFSTAGAIVLLERQATAKRVPGTDAGCGLSIRGLLAGPAICNESQWTNSNGVEGTLQHGALLLNIMAIISIISS